MAKLNNIITVSIRNLTFLRLEAKSPKRPAIDLMTTATIPRTIISHLDFDRGWPRLVANCTCGKNGEIYQVILIEIVTNFCGTKHFYLMHLFTCAK